MHEIFRSDHASRAWGARTLPNPDVINRAMEEHAVCPQILPLIQNINKYLMKYCMSQDELRHRMAHRPPDCNAVVFSWRNNSVLYCPCVWAGWESLSSPDGRYSLHCNGEQPHTWICTQQVEWLFTNWISPHSTSSLDWMGLKLSCWPNAQDCGQPNKTTHTVGCCQLSVSAPISNCNHHHPNFLPQNYSLTSVCLSFPTCDCKKASFWIALATGCQWLLTQASSFSASIRMASDLQLLERSTQALTTEFPPWWLYSVISLQKLTQKFIVLLFGRVQQASMGGMESREPKVTEVFRDRRGSQWVARKDMVSLEGRKRLLVFLKPELISPPTSCVSHYWN